MTEATETGRPGLTPSAMHDLNLAAMVGYGWPGRESPASVMLIAASRIALSAQATATEAMSCAAHFAAYANTPQHMAQAGKESRRAYRKAVECQQYAGMVANQYADLALALQKFCLDQDAPAVSNECHHMMEKMEDWNSAATHRSDQAADLIRRGLAAMGIELEAAK